ncbi:hypothetical protein STEG23_030549, partial [Scotinomys teguina]
VSVESSWSMVKFKYEFNFLIFSLESLCKHDWTPLLTNQFLSEDKRVRIVAIELLLQAHIFEGLMMMKEDEGMPTDVLVDGERMQNLSVYA